MCLSPRHQVLQSLLLKEPGVLEGSCREAVTSCRPARARLFAAGSFHDAAEGGRCADPSRRPLPPHGWLWLSAHTASVRAKRTHCHAWGRTARIAGKTRFLGVCLRASLGEVSVRLGRWSKKGHPRPPGWVSLLDGAGRGGEENSCSPCWAEPSVCSRPAQQHSWVSGLWSQTGLTPLAAPVLRPSGGTGFTTSLPGPPASPRHTVGLLSPPQSRGSQFLFYLSITCILVCVCMYTYMYVYVYGLAKKFV